MKTIIKVENISKVYQVDNAQEGMNFREMLKQQMSSLFKKDNKKKPFYALNNVSFEVKQGEVLGIIGKNGSGKSTLLKILSKITAPTSGKITVKGRVASLLEVGTGFHPELTGRENIFMNGVILGMKRCEVLQHFDEIVSFAGVEQFLDVPVKKYSSGMRLRLAFSVAAHLQPEILVVDEVLAVGDYEFEKKCLKLMEGITQAGRTIIFVSHNMDTIKRLCTRVVWLDRGEIKKIDVPSHTIDAYLGIIKRAQHAISWSKTGGLVVDPITLLQVGIASDDLNKYGYIYNTSEFSISLEYQCQKESNLELYFVLMFFNAQNDMLFVSYQKIILKKGLHTTVCFIPSDIFKEEYISISLNITYSGGDNKGIDSNLLLCLDKIIAFHIKDYVENKVINWAEYGLIKPATSWKYELQ